MLLASVPPGIPDSAVKRCLFLDFDGTLVDLESTPDDVQRDDALVALLQSLAHALGGAVAIVSGRRISAIDELVAPLRLPVAGIHGFERRSLDGITHGPALACGGLAQIRESLAELVAANPGLLLEDKSMALAVHYRNSPHKAYVVRQRLLEVWAAHGDTFELLEGSYVMEIKPATHNKATAVDAFMQEAPFVGRLPIYIGDDTTDRDGFMAAEGHGGMAIGVGSRVSAPWRLRDPAAVRAWLTEFNAACGAGP